MTPPEVERALRESVEALKEEFGDIIEGLGAVDLLKGEVLDFSYNLPLPYLRTHGRIMNLLRRAHSLECLKDGEGADIGSYYMFETEGKGLVVVFNVASRFAFIVHVRLDSIQMGTVLRVMLRELKDLLSHTYDERLLKRIEKIFSMR